MEHFLHYIPHIAGAINCLLLDVYRFASLPTGHYQISLSAEKGRNLKHVEHLSSRFDLRYIVDIG